MWLFGRLRGFRRRFLGFDVRNVMVLIALAEGGE